MSSDTYIGIHPNFTRTEYASIQKARNAGCMYLMKGNAQEGGPILDLNGEEMLFIEIGLWRLHNPIEDRKTGINVKSQVRIEDPLGEVQYYEIDTPLKIEKIVRLLKSLSSFNSWKEYRMYKRIEELEVENSELKSRLTGKTEKSNRKRRISSTASND